VGDKTNLTKTYPYGADLIPIDDTLLAQFSWNEDVSEKTLTTIGFVPIAHIPRSHFMDKSSVLQPHSDDPGSVTAMAALCEAMRNYSWQIGSAGRAEEAAAGAAAAAAAASGDGGPAGAPPDTGVGVGMLVRVQKRASSDPYLGVLMSQPTAYAASAVAALDGGEEAFDLDALTTLVLQRLPLREDVRDYLFPLLPDAETCTSAAQKDAVARMLESITVRTINPTGGGGVGGGLLVQDPTLVDYRRAVVDSLRGKPISATATDPAAASAAASASTSSSTATSSQSHTPFTHKFDYLSMCESSTASACLEEVWSAFGIEVVTGAAKVGACALATGAIQLATADSLAAATAAAAAPSKNSADTTGANAGAVTGGGAATSSARPKLKLHSLDPEHDLDAVVQYCNRDSGTCATSAPPPGTSSIPRTTFTSAFEREQLLIETLDTGLQIVQSRVASYHGPEAQRVAAVLLIKLRAMCVAEGLVGRFNDFLLEIFSEDEPDNIVFFDAYIGSGSGSSSGSGSCDDDTVTEKVSLVTDEEDSVSVVSAAVAADFAHTRYDSVRDAATKATAAAAAAAAAVGINTSSTHTQPFTAMLVDASGEDLFDDMD
jgi:hypothetical protein